MRVDGKPYFHGHFVSRHAHAIRSRRCCSKTTVSQMFIERVGCRIRTDNNNNNILFHFGIKASSIPADKPQIYTFRVGYFKISSLSLFYTLFTLRRKRGLNSNERFVPWARVIIPTATYGSVIIYRTDFQAHSKN